MALVFTPPMAKHMTPRVRRMVQNSLRFFPELEGQSITVGYTRGNLGTAYMPVAGARGSMGIRLKVHNLTYNTIGHEFTHLVQWLSRSTVENETPGEVNIPGGEKQCDIWTLARSELFCDDAPTYLKLPREIAGNWPSYAAPVRSLCIDAIEKRQTYRYYIRWLEDQIGRLVPKRKSKPHLEAPVQGWLPFV